MQTNKKDINKEIIIKTTLRLIGENEGIKDVNLRGIAKKIGCSHTNLYNYFSSLDEIFWEALGYVLLKMIDYVEIGLDSESNSEENFYLYLSNIIDFSMDHPGWYRLIWLESIGGSPSPEVIKILHKPNQKFCDALIKASSDNFSKEKAKFISDILHSYSHGELCKWINDRSFVLGKSETKIKIFSNLKLLYKLLIQEEF
ncbi:TetR/AcrR family transcriptional regulator [Clostridium estertheticum]|uniref:TetR/AcrR family transcriptional regulator n=1 Tax=Clostridium estertheticum TaxID=238834 RepID=UPI001C6E393F|nr:TetR/AcrR family transcriptional regulator [Clostridium estertheticum]MBW9153485.1 TetR/AcrR family transcriptional regulator [Clostridium estertheticum]WLC86384.1 TetR/AcrR family transcriptional regulator [Clostridium estertheticum]